MADSEIDVDRILAGIASADTNLKARGRTVPRFVVLGNARWNRYNNIDRTMFFKNHVIFSSTYHAKRDAQIVRDFDSAYIRAFGTLPTLYAYRGYDAAMIFVLRCITISSTTWRAAFMLRCRPFIGSSIP